MGREKTSQFAAVIGLLRGRSVRGTINLFRVVLTPWQVRSNARSARITLVVPVEVECERLTGFSAEC
jgi:hypothetical protein